MKRMNNEEALAHINAMLEGCKYPLSRVELSPSGNILYAYNRNDKCIGKWVIGRHDDIAKMNYFIWAEIELHRQ